MPDGQQQFLYPSINVANAVTNPGALGTITTMTLGNGLYDIEVWVGVSGTSVVAAESNNVKVSFGSADLSKLLPYTSTTAGTTNAAGPFRFRVFGDGVTALTTKAIGATTSTAVYAASVAATRIGP